MKNTIRWQMDKPQSRDCQNSSLYYSEQCSGQWYEVDGGNGQRGWIWSCIGTDCWFAAIAHKETP